DVELEFFAIAGHRLLRVARGFSVTIPPGSSERARSGFWAFESDDTTAKPWSWRSVPTPAFASVARGDRLHRGLRPASGEAPAVRRSAHLRRGHPSLRRRRGRRRARRARLAARGALLPRAARDEGDHLSAVVRRHVPRPSSR